MSANVFKKLVSKTGAISSCLVDEERYRHLHLSFVSSPALFHLATCMQASSCIWAVPYFPVLWHIEERNIQIIMKCISSE